MLQLVAMNYLTITKEPKHCEKATYCRNIANVYSLDPRENPRAWQDIHERHVGFPHPRKDSLREMHPFIQVNITTVNLVRNKITENSKLFFQDMGREYSKNQRIRNCRLRTPSLKFKNHFCLFSLPWACPGKTRVLIRGFLLTFICK